MSRRHVLEPFDYIVFDRAKLESDLRKDGIDPVVFDNIRTVTPAVYFMQNRWFVRQDNALTDDDLAGRAAYALEHVPDLIMRRQARILAIKPSPFGYSHLLRAKRQTYRCTRRATRPMGRLARLRSWTRTSTRLRKCRRWRELKALSRYPRMTA